MENLEEVYMKVKLIVHSQHRQYGIQLWDRADWEQEGLICLYQLVTQHPEVLENDAKLRTYFKTKFSNYIKDQLRAQESQKRRINKENYEDVHDLAYSIKCGGMSVEDLLMYQESLQEFKNSLRTQEDKQNYLRVLNGEQFKGRKAFLRRMRDFFE